MGMIPVGYKLVDIKTKEEVQTWGGSIGYPMDNVPNPIFLPNGDHLHGAQVGLEYNGYRLEVWEKEPPPLQAWQVDEERDQRIAAGFQFSEKTIQFRVSDRENINGAGTLAALAMMAGAQPGNYKWHGGEEDFAWITADNSLLRLDAFETVNLGKAAAAWKSAHIFAARKLKDQETIPEDYKDDKYWPQRPKVEGL
jgi:hypothetical protein